MIGPMLPAAEWRNAPDLLRIVEALADDLGGPLVVGGAVRDSLLGEQVTDIDLATPLHPETVIARLEAIRIKAIPTGIDHGTITAVGDGNNYEITTLRRDVATDGRRATVTFADNWREDAERRDFTINALYANPKTGEILDYFDGLEDLKAGKIRFIGDAKQRIAEDYLRILRYFRFLARFGSDDIDPEAIAACEEGAVRMTALSRERIAQELLKTLSVIDPTDAVALMLKHGIFAPFMPEASANADHKLKQLVEREQQFGTSPSVTARLIAILPVDIVLVEKVAARLKLSNRMRENLSARLKAPIPVPANIRAIAYRNDMDCARDVALLFASNSDVAACLQQLSGWEIPTFSIKGGDLIACGLKAGPVVAKTLRAVEAQWVAENFPEMGRLNEIADQAAAAAIAPLS